MATGVSVFPAYCRDVRYMPAWSNPPGAYGMDAAVMPYEQHAATTPYALLLAVPE
jgi:hypothetical protein